MAACAGMNPMVRQSPRNDRQLSPGDPSWPSIVFALNVLKDGADKGVLPDTYGADVRRGLDYALLKRWALRTAAGRLQITDAGRAELHLVSGEAL
jgi:hypothetical protein